MLVSILIPTYKRLNYLKEAVDSCLKQSYPDIEVIVIQDPTPDGLVEEITNWGKEISSATHKVKFYSNKTNKGLAGNWNECLSKANGEYIVIIGDDDRLMPNCIDELMIGIKGDADVSFSNHYLIDEKGEQLAISKENTKRFNRHYLSKGILPNAEKSIWENAIPISAALIKSNLAKEIKFKEQLNTPEIEMFLQINQLKGKFYFNPDYLAEYRVHPESATSSGLRVHLLFDLLKDFPVTKENYKSKWSFLNGLCSVSINLLLKNIERKKAFQLYTSIYYSWRNRMSLKGIAQLGLLLMPAMVIKKILK
ncbi:glycosyltransferase family 2 protein [Sporocytophaga myxococcoides]|uniref:glycosyltransferase family 2 protein n=1 Tax=Sporocytophaga myxococcoides TaxID=153721 RepID=UPI00048AF0C4|nr:glycosyltransferase family 2 protein [Sporocytophaga myxococcoides]